MPTNLPPRKPQRHPSLLPAAVAVAVAALLAINWTAYTAASPHAAHHIAGAGTQAR